MAIKKSPADFQVEEVLASAVALKITETPGAFALYRLSKESLATPEAASLIARQFQAPAGAIAYAGLKDKHARTTQHVTLKLAKPGAEAPSNRNGPGWSLERLGYVGAPITAEAIAANRFRIVARGLTQEACEEMDEAAKLLACPSPPGVEGLDGAAAASLLVVNYFGDQRFGSARHGQGFLARHLVKAEFEQALKLAIATPARKDRREDKERRRAIAEGWGRWQELLARLGERRFPERKALEVLARKPAAFRDAFTALPYLLQQLSVYAYQSFLWNEIARKLVTAQCAERGTLMEADDVFGVMAFPASAAVPPELRALDLPLLGHKSELKEPWRAVAEGVLAAEQLTTDQLRISGVRRPFFGEVPRALFVAAANFELAAPEQDETSGGRRKRALAFDLPRGAYATVVLRALGQ